MAVARSRRGSKKDSVFRTPGLIKTLITVASAFGSWALLLPVVPLAVITAGGSDTLAGGSTAAFMATTVVTQWFTPDLVRRFGYINVMMASALILGGPSFLYMFSIAPAPVLIISAIRGVGFGAICVAQAALIAEIVDQKFLGKASGLLGFVIGLTQMITLPVGLYIAENISFTATYIIATVIAVAATGLCLTLPKVTPAKKSDSSTTSSSTLPPVATWKLTTIPAIVVGFFAMGYGAVSSFLPAAVKELSPVEGAVISGLVLAVAAGSQMIARYAAGMVADRTGNAGATTIPSLVSGVVGLVMLALVLEFQWSPWLTLVAAVLFGAGFGAAQNEALLMMFARLPRSRVTDASALWNMAFDGGTGIGAVALGVVAGAAAYSGAFGVAAFMIFLALLAVWADQHMGRHRIAERNNTRARLRQVPVARKAYYGAKAAAQITKRPLIPSNRPAPAKGSGVQLTTIHTAPTGDDTATDQNENQANADAAAVTRGGNPLTRALRKAQKARAGQQALRRKSARPHVADTDSEHDDQRAGQDAARRAAGRSGRMEKKVISQLKNEQEKNS